MEFKVNVDGDKMIKDAMENQPEYSGGSVLRCVGWNYDDTHFRFQDQEENKEYDIHMEQLQAGLQKMFNFLADKSRDQDVLRLIEDPCNWDGEDVDMLVQFACLGEIVYG